MWLARVNTFITAKGYGFAEVLDRFWQPTGITVYFHVADAKRLLFTLETLSFDEKRESSRWLKSICKGQLILLEHEMTVRGLRATTWAYHPELGERIDEYGYNYYETTSYRLYRLNLKTGSLDFVAESHDLHFLSAQYPKQPKETVVVTAQYSVEVEYEHEEYGCGSYTELSDWTVLNHDPRIALSDLPPIIRELFGPRTAR